MDQSGIITTIAGNGSATPSGDGGPATGAGVPTPLAVAVDSMGNLYISSNVTVVRKVAPDGTISTYAGSGVFGSYGDGGPALQAALATPIGLAVDSAGNLYSIDLGNDRIRQIRPSLGPLAVLSQQGLTFSAVAGAAPPATQSFAVVNAGSGSLNWSATPTVPAGNPPWLIVTPLSGVSLAGGAGEAATVSVDPSGLAPGAYYGKVLVTAPGSPNSPQSLTVVLSLLPAGQGTGVSVQPAGLLFVGAPSGSASDPQSILLSASLPDNFTATLDFDGGPAWLSATPLTGAMAAGANATILIQPAAGLAAGVYRGTVNLKFSGGTTQVQLLMVLAAQSPATARGKARPRFGDCAPQKLLPLITSLSPGFSVAAGWPTPIVVQVVDDCSQPLTDGVVIAAFNSGDPPIVLKSLQDGNWAGTWSAAHTGGVSVAVTATSAAAQLTGSASVTVGLRANANPPPAVQHGGVVNAASLAPGASRAPGTQITIFGSQLAASPVQAQELPLPHILGGTSVIVSGEPLPLLAVQPDRISAILPLDLAIDTTHQLIVTGGSSISLPEPISLVSSNPAIFTQDGSGQGPAVITVIAPDNSQSLVGPNLPVTAGQTIVLTCTGLGNVNPLAVAGSPAASVPLSVVVDAPTVTVGGIAAQIRFAALTPGGVGIYQIGAIVPQGVAPGDNVPVVATQIGGSTQTVSIPVR